MTSVIGPYQWFLLCDVCMVVLTRYACRTTWERAMLVVLILDANWLATRIGR